MPGGGEQNILGVAPHWTDAEAPEEALPAEVYLVLIKDRHSGIDGFVFSTSSVAIVEAEKWLVVLNSRYPDDVDRELSDGLVNDGCVWNAQYGPEGDYICVLRRKVDD